MSDNIESQDGQIVYYDGNKVLSILDAEGKKPTVIMVEGNRSAGKTFFFKRKLLRNFMNDGKKFVVIRRRKNQVKNVDKYFAKDVMQIDEKLARHRLTQKPVADGQVYELLFDGAQCGFVVPLSARDLIKEMSPLFVDVYQNFFDEFQAESTRYVENEWEAFKSVTGSIARGGGLQSRYVPTIMCANTCSMFNPYYIQYGLDTRINKRQKFYRGKGFVLERTYNESAARAFRENHRDAEGTRMMKFATSNDYLLDTNAFVSDIAGQKRLVAVLNRREKKYGIWYAQNGIVYVSRKYDPRFPMRVTLDVNDHKEGDILCGTNTILYKQLLAAYMRGSVYFDCGNAREAYISCVSQLQPK